MAGGGRQASLSANPKSSGALGDARPEPGRAWSAVSSPSDAESAPSAQPRLECVRQVYAHEALLDLGPDADLGAPGAAITGALCGSWEHEGPCPLAPHHTAVRRDGSQVRLHVVFTTEPHDEEGVRARIVDALSSGRQTAPNGATAMWTLAHQAVGAVEPEEVELGTRLGGAE